MIPRYSAQDYRSALLNLLPLGPIWSGFRGGAGAALFLVLGRVYARNNERAANLISDLFPATTSSFLTEWENTLGLPDSCTGPLPTAEQRRNAIVAKLTDEGGSSIDYYRRIAAAAGFTVTIKNYTPFRAGLGRAGDPVRGEDWAFAWEIQSTGVAPVKFRAGQNCAGEPLANWGNGLLECLIRCRSPANTIPIFTYSLAPTVARLNDFAGDII